MSPDRWRFLSLYFLKVSKVPVQLRCCTASNGESCCRAWLCSCWALPAKPLLWGSQSTLCPCKAMEGKRWATFRHSPNSSALADSPYYTHLLFILLFLSFYFIVLCHLRWQWTTSDLFFWCLNNFDLSFQNLSIMLFASMF